MVFINRGQSKELPPDRDLKTLKAHMLGVEIASVKFFPQLLACPDIARLESDRCYHSFWAMLPPRRALFLFSILDLFPLLNIVYEWSDGGFAIRRDFLKVLFDISLRSRRRQVMDRDSDIGRHSDPLETHIGSVRNRVHGII